MLARLIQIVDKINRVILYRNLFQFFIWFVIISSIFFITNSVVRKRIKTTIQGQINLNVNNENYDQILRYFSQLDSLQLVTCPEVSIVSNGEVPRILIHKSSDQCDIKWWEIFTSNETISVLTPNNKHWKIAFLFTSDLFSLVYFYIIIFLGWIFIFTFNMFRNKIKNQKEAALLKDFELKNTLYIEARKYAHDIRSPLSAFNAIAFSLKLTHPDQVSLINSALKKISELTDSFLNSIKTNPNPQNPENQNIKIFNLKNLICSEIEQKNLEYELIKSGKIKLDFQEINHTTSNLDYVIPSEIAIKRIISNLVNNAIESIPTEGNVKVLLENDALKAQIKILDTGTGIPNDILAILGSQIVTSKRYGNGFGVFDSSIALKSIGGKLQFNSSPNGTICTLQIPAVNK